MRRSTGSAGSGAGANAEVKPFATAGTQRMAGDASFEGQTDVGVDVKYALTSNLTFDLTWNTDFAQVESDNVQINLTRFDLFYPEKREFFLERAGLFQFGTPRQTEVFFSRRVGLRGDIAGGGRLTGQAGPLSIGALALRTRGYSDDAVALPAAWNSVVRLRTDLRPRTTLGGIISSLDHENGWDRTAGVDFSSRFWSSSSFNVWAARVWNPDFVPSATGASGSAGSAVSGGSPDPREAGSANAASAELVLQNDLYVAGVSRLVIDDGFQPALGFVPRTDQDRWQGRAGVTPRFESSAWARQLTLEVGGHRIRGRDGAKQTHQLRASAGLSFQSGEFATIALSERFERLELPARISRRLLAAGDYSFRRLTMHARTNDSRTFSGALAGSIGDFWSGTRTEIGGGATWITGPHLTIGGRYAWNGVSLPVDDGDFSTHLVSANIQGAVSRKLFANALVQWDNHSRELQANIRIDWIHTPRQRPLRGHRHRVSHRRPPRPARTALAAAHGRGKADVPDGVLRGSGSELRSRSGERRRKAPLFRLPGAHPSPELPAGRAFDDRTRRVGEPSRVGPLAQQLRQLSGHLHAEPRVDHPAQHFRLLHARPADAFVTARTHTLVTARAHALVAPPAEPVPPVPLQVALVLSLHLRHRPRPPKLRSRDPLCRN